MSVASRWIDVPSEDPHRLVVGYVLQHLARQCEFNAEELANKAGVGVGFVRRIYGGLAPFMKESQIYAMVLAMDLTMSEFYAMVEGTSVDQVRTVLRAEKLLVAAGGARVKTPAPKPRRRRRLKAMKGEA